MSLYRPCKIVTMGERTVYRAVHGEETQETADELRDRFRHKNTVHAPQKGQKYGEGGVDDGFAEDGEENRLLGLAQPNKNGLAGDHQGHEYEHGEVHPQGRHAGLEHVRVVVEDADEQAGNGHV